MTVLTRNFMGAPRGRATCVPATRREPVTLRQSGLAVTLLPGGGEFRIPYTGTLTPAAQAVITSALRRLMIEMRYGTRLKGLTVSACDQVLTVTTVASHFAISQWLESGEFAAAVDAAVRQTQ